VTEEKILEKFDHLRPSIEEVRIIKTPEGKVKGYGYVIMKLPEFVDDAINTFM